MCVCVWRIIITSPLQGSLSSFFYFTPSCLSPFIPFFIPFTNLFHFFLFMLILFLLFTSSYLPFFLYQPFFIYIIPYKTKQNQKKRRKYYSNQPTRSILSHLSLCASLCLSVGIHLLLLTGWLITVVGEWGVSVSILLPCLVLSSCLRTYGRGSLFPTHGTVPTWRVIDG